MTEIPWDQLLNGGQLCVALVLAFQIKRILANHEIRITTLEANSASSRNRKRRKSAVGTRSRRVV